MDLSKFMPYANITVMTSARSLAKLRMPSPVSSRMPRRMIQSLRSFVLRTEFTIPLRSDDHRTHEQILSEMQNEHVSGLPLGNIRILFLTVVACTHSKAEPTNHVSRFP